MLFQKALSSALDVKVEVTVGAIVYNTSATSVAVAYPTDVRAGDLLVVIGLIQSATAAGAITGWTNLATSGTYATVSHITATGGETGTVTVSWTGNATGVHIMYKIRMSRYGTLVNPIFNTTYSGLSAVNPSLTLTVPASYSHAINLVTYLDNSAINMTGLNANLIQLAYRTTSHGMYAGWINSSDTNMIGATITSNSNGNTLSAREFSVYIT